MKSSRCLLIVDDEPELRELIRDLCRELTTNILTAADGLEALEVAHSQSVDAIISDISMPRMNGLELLTELRAEGFETPFIILSGYGDKNNTIQALRLGAADFVDKPFEDDRLIHIIETALEIGYAINQTETEIEQLFNQFQGSKTEIEKLKKTRSTLLNLKKDYHLRIKREKAD